MTSMDLASAVPARAPSRAAQYVRMSTKHQQYSPENQLDIIIGTWRVCWPEWKQCSSPPSRKMVLHLVLTARSACESAPAEGVSADSEQTTPRMKRSRRVLDEP